MISLVCRNSNKTFEIHSLEFFYQKKKRKEKKKVSFQFNEQFLNIRRTKNHIMQRLSQISWTIFKYKQEKDHTI